MNDAHGKTYEAKTHKQRKYRFELIPFDDLRPGTDVLFIVKPIIPRHGITLIWGPPKCGKSFWVFDLMMHVAFGWEYRGHRVLQGSVVYCAFEGADGFKLRAEAFRRQHPDMPHGAPFHLIGVGADLFNDHLAMIGDMKAQLGNLAPLILVLDTLNRSLCGSESSDEDMAAYIRAADTIREELDCAVIIVHHCGHDDKRPRGHSSLLGAIDAQIAVSRDAQDNVLATVERMKDGPEAASITSRLEQVEVGIDADGDPITSCRVEPCDTAAAEKKHRGKDTLPKAARIALDALADAILTGGETPPASSPIPPNVRAVSVNLWREYSYRRGISAADTTDRARQQAFKRASAELLATHKVAMWGDHVWVV